MLLCCGGTLSAQPEVIADPNIPIEERIQNAIERMTPEEKVRLETSSARWCCRAFRGWGFCPCTRPTVPGAYAPVR